MNKTYLIVGASSDLGCELIREINEEESGALIYAHYRTSAKALEAIELKNGNRMVCICADLAKKDGAQIIIERLLADQQIPNCIVHMPSPKYEFIKLSKLSWEQCEEDAYIQVASAFNILKQFLPGMSKQEGDSKVVLVLSENTIGLPAKYSTKYTMSKYMLLGLMKSLVAEYEGKKVNINAVSPSMIDTKLLSNIDRRVLEMSGATQNMLMPKDVAPAIMKLLSSDSDEMFGENVIVNEKI